MKTQAAVQHDVVENLDHLTEDNREICFEQGKPCIYQDEDHPDHIITEWPNGVMDTKDLVTATTVRRWPDGQTEKLTGERLEQPQEAASRTRAGRLDH